jgi:hypothetical protein
MYPTYPNWLQTVGIETTVSRFYRMKPSVKLLSIYANAEIAKAVSASLRLSMFLVR